MEQAEFVRSVADRLSHFSWFLGAGTSQSAGLPTAVDVIWDLKRRYYGSEENQAVSTHDMQNTAVREKIHAYMQSKGFPQTGSPEEYSTFFDLIFKDDMARQQRYIHAMLSDERVSLSLGHRVLGALLASKITRVVFTTNFDNVVEKAVAEVSGQALAFWAGNPWHPLFPRRTN